jgi:acetolactate synthase small subunit
VIPTTISIVVDEAMIPLDRALGVVRRRNLRIISLTLSPGPVKGTTLIVAQAAAEPADAQQLAAQLRKLVGVRDAAVNPVDAPPGRQLALARLRPAGERGRALLAAVELAGGTLLEAGPEGCVVQVIGTVPEVRRGLTSLESFGILDTAWSGPVALAAQTAPAEDAVPTSTEDDWS